MLDTFFLRELQARLLVASIDGANQTLANLSSGGRRASLDLAPDLDENARFDDRVLGGGDFAERILRLADQVTAEKKASWAEFNSINFISFLSCCTFRRVRGRPVPVTTTLARRGETR
jgi:hypothetical protein